MLVLADTHVHFYPVYNLDRWLSTAFAHLSVSAPHVRVVCLTERHDCHAFRDNIFRGERAGKLALRVTRDGQSLFVLAGRQVVTAERLEALALCTDAEIPDGLPMAETLKRIRAEGAAPALAWAPGKWFFARGRVVTHLLETEPPGSLLIGDTSLRPTVWADPDLMTFGHARGFNVIAGSDPLPFAGDEISVGRYGVRCEIPFDAERPGESFLAALKNPATRFHRAGRRCGVMEWLARRRAHKRASRRAT